MIGGSASFQIPFGFTDDERHQVQTLYVMLCLSNDYEFVGCSTNLWIFWKILRCVVYVGALHKLSLTIHFWGQPTSERERTYAHTYMVPGGSLQSSVTAKNITLSDFA